MTPKEKANELVEKYKPYVHGYVGSSMLTNYEYPEQILSQAKKAALIAVNEILLFLSLQMGFYDEKAVKYFEEVKQEIENL